jgi:Tol biopolymer transport system component
MLTFVGEDPEGRDQLWVQNLAGGEPVQITDGTAAVRHPAWSPVGDQIVYAERNNGLWSVPPLGGTPRQILDHGAYPNLSPDGKRLAFVSYRRIWVADANGGGAEPLKGHGESYFGYLSSPAYSPDGDSIAYFQPHPDRPLGDIWIVPSAGGEGRQVTFEHFRGGDPVWTPDGEWIVFVSNHGGSTTLWRVSVRAGTVEPVTTGAGDDLQPTVSSDGKRIVYTNTRPTYSLERLNSATGELQTVLARRTEMTVPELSPSRDRLAFFARSQDGIHLFSVGIDGEKVFQVTRGEDELNTHPRWSSDGNDLYFYQEEPTQGIRMVPIRGGSSREVLPGWTWVSQNRVRFSPGDRYLAYTEREEGRLIAAKVSDLKSGEEWSLDQALFACQWSADGQKILGTGSDGVIYLCPFRGEECNTVTSGDLPQFSPDGQRVYFLRARFSEFWSSRLDGTDERMHGPVEGYEWLSFNYGILADGDIIWNKFTPSQPELWSADLR